MICCSAALPRGPSARGWRSTAHELQWNLENILSGRAVKKVGIRTQDLCAGGGGNGDGENADSGGDKLRYESFDRTLRKIA